MEFEEALKVIKEDKSKKVKYNALTLYISDDGGLWSNYSGEDNKLLSEPSLNGDIWKVAEEETLSEELSIYTPAVINEVKEANKRFIDFLEAREKSIEIDRHETIRQGAKRIYGDKLV